MNKLKQFLADFNISTHTLVAVFGMFTAFLAIDASARGIVFGFLSKHPFYSLAFGFAAFASAKYSGSHSTQGVVGIIASAPKQDVAAAITAVAAETKPVVVSPLVPNLQNVVDAAAAKTPIPDPLNVVEVDHVKEGSEP